MPPGETTEERTRRLRKEGRWQEFQDRIAELKGEGYTPRKAYRAAVEEFLPAAKPSTANNRASLDERAATRLIKAARGRDSTVLDDVEWVRQTMAVGWRDIDSKTVPAPSAIAMLKFAKANPREFFAGPFAKVTPSRAEAEQQDRLRNDGRIQLDKIAEFRRLEEAAGAKTRTGPDSRRLPQQGRSDAVLPPGPQELAAEPGLA